MHQRSLRFFSKAFLRIPSTFKQKGPRLGAVLGGNGNRGSFQGTVAGNSGTIWYLCGNGNRLSGPLPCCLNSVKGRLDFDDVTDF